ncbi:MAG: peptide MFS transporter [Bacteroidales bacterium]|nr:peptide MFS transporter [Bacteroidales bacterium]
MFKGHPKGLIPAALSNMGERFGYYIMNAVLVLFLCSKFGLKDETGTAIYSVFYAGIYVLSLVGGIIADRLQNYKGTIITGLCVMSVGYALLAIPIVSTSGNISWLLPLTCFALFLIACGNGLFKGNLQVIIGQMYDNLESDAAKEGPEALKKAKEKRDSGFQIFYVFINIGGLVAPFVAPLLRGWWLKLHGFVYNADLPALCHSFINDASAMTAEQSKNLVKYAGEMGIQASDFGTFCPQYLDVFNTGIHYSFIASVLAMALSLVIFLVYKKGFPNPGRKTGVVSVEYSPEEKKAAAKEIKQRLYALFAVLGIAVFFWFSFHQNGTSMSLFARDFVNTSSIAPEIWQAVNPFFVIVLTPIIMWFFGLLGKRGKYVSTPKKIAIGMGIAALAYIFVSVFSYHMGYPSAEDFKGMEATAKAGLKAGPWVLIVYYFFMTVAELFISPLGLSFASKVAPKNLLGLCQGLWLGATAVGNGILWVGPLMYNKWPIWICWAVFFGVCALSMLVMLFMVKWLERVTGETAAVNS